MEYVRRAIYGPNHPLSHMTYNRVHLSDGNETLCGKVLNEMWFVVGNESEERMKVTCPKCKALFGNGQFVR